MNVRLFIFLLIAIIGLTGCFDYEVEPPDAVVGTVIGCHSEGEDLFCLTRYEGHGKKSTSDHETPIPIADRVYECEIDGAKQVYDGDTITDVRIRIVEPTLLIVEQLGEVFPGIIVEADGVYIENGIRIAGIDTPEMRPSTKDANGFRRSESSRQKEKQAAIAARDEVARLIEANGWIFMITDVDYDKYGRVLATVFAGGIDVGAYLIQQGLALPYDGGTKPEWNWE